MLGKQVSKRRKLREELKIKMEKKESKTKTDKTKVNKEINLKTSKKIKKRMNLKRIKRNNP